MDGEGPERRVGTEVILLQLTQLSEGQTRMETALERLATDHARAMLELERSMGRRVTELEKWQAAEIARHETTREVERDHGDDKGAQMLKVMVLALSCLAFLLYLVANGGHL